jgi:hypothetical protein
MSWAIPIAILFVVAIGILYAARRAITLFEIVAEAGKIAGARGRIPPELLRDLEDVFARAKASGKLRVHLDGGRAQVDASGLDDPTLQRVRNVVGRFPIARLKTAPRL